MNQPAKTTRGRKPVERPSEARPAVKSIRMCDETYESLNTVKQALRADSVEGALKAMLDTFSMTQAKEMLPERSTEISEFEVLCRRLIDAYTHSLLIFQDAEARAREEVKKELEVKDATISRMHEELEARRAELADTRKTNSLLLAERNAAVAEADVLKRAQEAGADISSRFDQMQTLLEHAITGKIK